MVAEALLDALDRLRNTGPEFNSFLANHGPMAAEAIVQLGADDEVAGWVDRYRTRLTPEPVPRERIAVDECGPGSAMSGTSGTGRCSSSRRSPNPAGGTC